MCAPKISLIFVIDLGLYVSLITLPGSGPYKIFHPVIYSKALQTLQIIKKIPALHGLPRRYLKLYTSVLNWGNKIRSVKEAWAIQSLLLMHSYCVMWTKTEKSWILSTKFKILKMLNLAEYFIWFSRGNCKCF